MPGWGLKLLGTYLSGGDDTDVLYTAACSGIPVTGVGCLSKPPAGLGLPGLRTEDTTFSQRDGVKHYADWYEPRLITAEKVTVCNDNCGCGTTGNARLKQRQLTTAWGRTTCCDTELVIYTDCHGDGIVGDPIPVQQSFRTNLVSNPSAETDLDDWVNMFSEFYSMARETWSPLPPVGGSFAATLTTTSAGTRQTTIGIGSGNAAAPGGVPVTAGSTYTMSMYCISNKTPTVTPKVIWYFSDGSTSLGTDTGSATALTANTWARISLTATAPDGAAKAFFYAETSSIAWSVNDKLGAEAVLFEKTGELLDYFDGDTPDTDNPVVDGEKIVNVWAAVAQASQSYQQVSVYEENVDRSLVGPFGAVGRPRVAEFEWLGQGSSCGEALLRFDALDHRLYVLDECGTPGFGKCYSIYAGSGVTQTLCREYDTCYMEGGRCYNVGDTTAFVPPPTVMVGGTERVFPTITLFPNLLSPRITNVTTGEFIVFNGAVLTYPVVINTEDGTAFQNGASVTHLLGGSIFLSMVPGDYEFQLDQFGSYGDGTGYADICFRDTVKSA